MLKEFNPSNLLEENIDKGAGNSKEANETIKADDFKKTYEHRKALIEKSDKELIESALKEGNAFQDSTDFILLRLLAIKTEDFERRGRTDDAILYHKELIGKTKLFKEEFLFKSIEEMEKTRKEIEDFIERFKSKTMIIVGCGQDGPGNAINILKNLPALEIKNIILIDPFLTEEYIAKATKAWCGTEGCDECDGEGKQKVADKIKFFREDGLSFLLSQPDESGNVMTGSINSILIKENDYLKRLGQEIFRVVPRDGVYLSVDSDTVEEEAGEMFSQTDTEGNYGAKVFLKKTVTEKK